MSFRRMLTLLAVVFLFAGIAAAQSGDTQPFTCSTVAQVTPTLRAEGLTELVGDIVITCTGGNAFIPSVNTPFIPTANITVSLTNKVTSRLVNGQVSEALLLIDEPGSSSTRIVTPGYGPAAPLKLCGNATNPLQGQNAGTCNQYVKWIDKNTGALQYFSGAAGAIFDATGAAVTGAALNNLNNANFIQVGFNADLGQGSTATAASIAAAVAQAPNATVTVGTQTGVQNQVVNNAWQGVVVGNNQIQFQGIPVLPPVSTGISRVYRITNIRVSAGNSQPVNGVSVVTQVQAYLSNSGSTSLPINSNGITVGFVQSSLNLSSSNNYGVYKLNSFTQCDTTKGTSTWGTTAAGSYLQLAAILRFGELFPSAFKTRLAPVGTAGFAFGGTNAATTSSPTSTFVANTLAVPTNNKQNVPGAIYNSESGFIVESGNLGLADNGTRLQAKFTGVPKGVTVYVTRTNITGINFGRLSSNDYAGWAPASAPTSATVLTNSYAEFVQPAQGASIADKTGFNSVGFSPFGATTATVGSASTQLINVTPGSFDANNVGNSNATWEVLSSNASTSEDFAFLVFVAYNPAAGTSGGPALPIVDAPASASLWYGDQSTLDSAQGAWNATFGTGAYIPRFGTGGTSSQMFTIGRCSTVLLFPYVTTNAGYDTGVAISNTSADPLGTPTSTADVKCDVTPYGAWYNGATQVSVASVPKWSVTVQPGQTNAGLLSASLGAVPSGATGFSGYLFAQCNFQFAHGFAFITNTAAGNQGQTMGYLALIVNGGIQNATVRPGALYGESLNN